MWVIGYSQSILETRWAYQISLPYSTDFMSIFNFVADSTVSVKLEFVVCIEPSYMERKHTS